MGGRQRTSIFFDVGEKGESESRSSSKERKEKGTQQKK